MAFRGVDLREKLRYQACMNRLRTCATITCLAAGAVLAVLPSEAAESQTLPTLPVVSYALSNGLQVTLHEDHTSPVVAVNIWYHVGSKDEPDKRNGFAHLFEHLMFQGSKHVGEDQFFQYLEKAGASDKNGTTSTDRTNYYETVPSSQFELALWLESDRMGYLLDHVDQKTLDEQRDVVKNERRQSYENAPYGLVHKFLQEALYPPTHPYYRLTIGSYEDLDAATLGDVKNFFKTFYVPNNARLVVAGDIEPTKARALIDKYFGPLPKQGQPKVFSEPMPVKVLSEKVLQIEAGVELPRVYITYPTPSIFAPGDAALDAVSRVLSHGKSSRLYKRLVYDLQIASDVHAAQSSSQLASEFFIVATAKDKHTPNEILKVIDEELASFQAKPPTKQELDQAKTSLEADLIYHLESVGHRADMFNSYAQLAHDPGFFSKDVARYRSLQVHDLQEAAKTWLSPQHRVVALVTPNPAAPRAGQLKGARP